MTEPLRDNDPRLDEWEREFAILWSHTPTHQHLALAIDRVRALERERDEAKNALIQAVVAIDEARAVARRLAAGIREEAAKGTSETFTRMSDALDAFDALAWAKD